MIIEYKSDEADMILEGNGYRVLRWVKKRDTNVVLEMWEAVRLAVDDGISFENTVKIIKGAYKNKKSRSCCDVITSTYQENGEFVYAIEIIRKGVFPSILIIKE